MKIDTQGLHAATDQNPFAPALSVTRSTAEVACNVVLSAAPYSFVLTFLRRQFS